MGSPWAALFLLLCISVNVEDVNTKQCPTCPHTTRTTTQHTTTHPTTTHHTTTQHTTTHHTTTHPTTTHHTTTQHTTTTHPTTAHTNHTTTHPTTAHPTTARTNHTTTHPTTAHTNHTTHPTTAHPTTAHTNHTTTHPTSMPPPVDFFINGSSGVCLRISASLRIILNLTEEDEFAVPPPPLSNVSGSCSEDTAGIILSFTRAHLSLSFRKDAANKVFFLEQVNITARSPGSVTTGSASLKAMVTPLGRSFSCPSVTVGVISTVLSLEAANIRAQAFELRDGAFGTAMDCSNPARSSTVPIVVGVILAVLILVVVLAYALARCRPRGGYQPL